MVMAAVGIAVFPCHCRWDNFGTLSGAWDMASITKRDNGQWQVKVRRKG